MDDLDRDRRIGDPRRRARSSDPPEVERRRRLVVIVAVWLGVVLVISAATHLLDTLADRDQLALYQSLAETTDGSTYADVEDFDGATWQGGTEQAAQWDQLTRSGHDPDQVVEGDRWLTARYLIRSWASVRCVDVTWTADGVNLWRPANDVCTDVLTG